MKLNTFAKNFPHEATEKLENGENSCKKNDLGMCLNQNGGIDLTSETQLDP